jgi:thiol-disulfide isomerase/thioredoxin
MQRKRAAIRWVGVTAGHNAFREDRSLPNPPARSAWRRIGFSIFRFRPAGWVNLSRLILIDFTAAWCSLCREIEANVLRNTEIRSRLKSVSIIRADMTDYSSENQAPMRRFGVVDPPTLVVLDPENGREIEGGGSIGALTIPAFKSFLDRAGA